MRNNGRRLEKMRPVKIIRNYIRYAEGSCLIEMGNTKVVCTATIEESVPPFLRDSGRGWVTAEYGMLPRSTHTRSLREGPRGKISGRIFEIQRLIGRSLRAVVDLDKLGHRTIKLDADVIQADGGTRCASITGSFVALALALERLKKEKLIEQNPIKGYVAAISVGFVDSHLMIDLDYEEDSLAEVDMNVVMTDKGKLVEVQATAEKNAFSKTQLNNLVDLASKGIAELIVMQKKEVRIW
ncbi:MAG: ribonuclease PH [Candidatus Omnitrophota bacterium]